MKNTFEQNLLSVLMEILLHHHNIIQNQNPNPQDI